MFTIDSKAFVASLQAAQGKLDGFVTSTLERTSKAAATYAKLTTLFRHRTYALRSSIRHGVKSKFRAQTAATAKHASWLEEGTRPHVIQARRKKSLRFVQNGAVRFTQRVHHPGTKPRPFMQQARDRAEPLFVRLCNEVTDRIFG